MKNVLLTYGWCRTAYVSLKSLSNKGLSTYVLDSSPTAMCRFSNLKKEFIKMPLYINNEGEYIEFLIDTIKKYSINVFIPVNEEIIIIAKYKNKFPDRVNIPIEEYEMLLKVNNKKSSVEHAINQNIPVPKTYIINNLEETEKIADKICFPAVIKPLQSQGSKGICYVSNKQELINIYMQIVKKKGLNSADYPLVQEYVKGDGYGVSCLFDHGKLKAMFTHKRILEKICSGGTSTRRISVKNHLLEKYAVKYLSSLNWHGIAMVEFKYDIKEGKGYFLEVNPRLWGSINLPFISGVDFPYLLYKVAIGEDFEPVLDYKTDIQSNWVLGDMLALIDYMVNSKERVGFLKKFINFKADGYDDFNRKDIKPFFGEFFDYFRKFVHNRSRNPEYKRPYGM